MIEHLLAVAPEGTYGCRPGRGAADAAHRLLHRIDIARAAGDPFHFASLDAKQHFDRLSHEPLHGLIDQLRLPPFLHDVLQNYVLS